MCVGGWKGGRMKGGGNVLVTCDLHEHNTLKQTYIHVQLVHDCVKIQCT